MTPTADNSRGASRSEQEKYTYRVTWSEEDGEFVALVAELPSLSWLDKSDAAALAGLRRLVGEVVADMKRSGEPVPEPISVGRYSGQFKVRIPPVLHRRLAIEAAENHVSLNRLVSMKLAGG